jgi:hypothetical protein
MFVGIRSVAELRLLQEGFRSLRVGQHILSFHTDPHCFGFYIVSVGRRSVAHDVPPSETKFTHCAEKSSILKKGRD